MYRLYNSKFFLLLVFIFFISFLFKVSLIANNLQGYTLEEIEGVLDIRDAQEESLDLIKIEKQEIEKEMDSTIEVVENEVSINEVIEEHSFKHFFPDYNLARAMSIIMKGTPDTNLNITAIELSNFDNNGEVLDLEYNEIQSLQGIQYLKSISKINLQGNKIVDVSPLSYLTSLNYVNLESNQILDISPISFIPTVLANNQLITLDTIPYNHVVTGIFIRSTEGRKPSALTIQSNNGVYNYDEGTIQWTNLDSNTLKLSWIDNNFSGTIVQYLDLMPFSYYFDDPELMSFIASKFNKQPTDFISVADLNNFSGENGLLNASNRNIRSLKGMSYLKSIVDLNLTGNRIGEMPQHLEELQYMESLRSLQLNRNGISQIEPIGKLLELNSLFLDNNQIRDISHLAHLKELRRLGLNNNQISNLEPLKELTQLTSLWLTNNNQINNLESLSELKSLVFLSLNNNNQIRSFEPISELISLEQLSLNNTQISDLTPLSRLTNLNAVWLQDNRVNNLEPLRGLTNLSSINLDRNEILDLSPISFVNTVFANRQSIVLHPITFGFKTEGIFIRNRNAMHPSHIQFIGPSPNSDNNAIYNKEQGTVKWTHPGYNQISWNDSAGRHFSGDIYQYVSGNTFFDFFPDNNLARVVARAFNREPNQGVTIEELANFTENINASNESIRSVDGLRYLTSVTNLNLSNNQVNDIPQYLEEIGLMKSLKILNLDNNKLQDIKFLSNLDLNELYLNNNNLFTLTSLSNMTELKVLEASNNNISNLIPLNSLTNLTTINLSNNLIGQVEPLSYLNNLIYLNIDNNNVMDLSPLAQRDLMVYARNQSVELAPYADVDIELRLLNNNNSIPNILFENSLGSYVEDTHNGNIIIRWNNLGYNVLTWNENNFSGKLEQFIVGQTFYEIFPDINLAKGVAEVFNRDVHDKVSLFELSTFRGKNENATLDLSRRGIRNLTSIGLLSSIEDLDISYNELDGYVGHVKYMNSLSKLDLSGNNINKYKETLNLLGFSLDILIANNKEIEDYDVSYLTLITNLKELHLNNNKIKNLPLEMVTSVNKLYLNDNRITDLYSLSSIQLEILEVNNQEVNLEHVGILEEGTPLFLRTIAGTKPYIINFRPEGGIYGFNRIIWGKRGLNTLIWKDNYYNFSGKVTQQVTPRLGNNKIAGGEESIPKNNLNSNNLEEIIIYNEYDKEEDSYNTHRVIMTIGSNEVLVNNQSFFIDTFPYIKNNRAMIPVRFLANGFYIPYSDIKWEDEEQLVTITTENKKIEIRIGEEVLYLNGEAKPLTDDGDISNLAVAEIRDNRTFVPVRAIAEALGIEFVWGELEETITFYRVID